MKSNLLPLLSVTALAGLMALPVSLGAGVTLLITSGMGAIILQDYSGRYRGLRLPRRRAREVRIAFRPPAMQPVASNRLAA